MLRPEGRTARPPRSEASQFAAAATQPAPAVPAPSAPLGSHRAGPKQCFSFSFCFPFCSVLFSFPLCCKTNSKRKRPTKSPKHCLGPALGSQSPNWPLGGGGAAPADGGPVGTRTACRPEVEHAQADRVSEDASVGGGLHRRARLHGPQELRVVELTGSCQTGGAKSDPPKTLTAGPSYTHHHLLPSPPFPPSASPPSLEGTGGGGGRGEKYGGVHFSAPEGRLGPRRTHRNHDAAARSSRPRLSRRDFPRRVGPLSSSPPLPSFPTLLSPLPPPCLSPSVSLCLLRLERAS